MCHYLPPLCAVHNVPPPQCTLCTPLCATTTYVQYVPSLYALCSLCTIQMCCALCATTTMCTMCHHVPPLCALCTTTMCTMCWPVCHHYVPCSHTGVRRCTPPVSWMAIAYHHTLSYHTILHHMCLCFDCHVITIPYHRITWLRPPYNEKPVPIQVNTREK